MESISQVSKKSSKHVDKLSLIAVCAVCLGIFIVMVWPKSKSVITDVERGNKSSYLDSTLQDNLNEAKKLKEMAEKEKIEALFSSQRQAVMLPAPANRLPIEREVSAPQVANDNLSQEVKVRMNSPSTFINNDDGNSQKSVSYKDKSGVQEASILSHGADGDFLNSKGAFGAVSATQLSHPSFTVPAGELISATLETAINSQLPGMVRAITTRDIYSLTESRKLIPRGSTLVGQFNSGVVQGQTRIAVIWNRLQLPSGVVISLESPGTDSMGRSGQGADFVNHHFFERFGSSVMLSLLGSYASNAGVSSLDQMNSKAMFKNQIASSMQAASSAELGQNMSIKPTMDIHQGTNINIFVAHDLSFYQVMRGQS